MYSCLFVSHTYSLYSIHEIRLRERESERERERERERDREK